MTPWKKLRFLHESEKLFGNFQNFRRRGPRDAQFKILEMIAHVSAINSVQKSSKSELSSRFFGRLKLAENTFIGEDFSETPLLTFWRNPFLFWNPRFSHRDRFRPKIVEIGAILAIFQPFEDFARSRKSSRNMWSADLEELWFFERYHEIRLEKSLQTSKKTALYDFPESE